MKKSLTLFLVPGMMAFSSPIFTPVKEEIKTGPSKENFDPGSFFRDRQDQVNLHVWESFDDNVLKHAQTVGAKPEIFFKSQDLTVRSDDARIISELGLKPMVLDDALWSVSELLMGQPKGEQGDLTNIGYANIFYVEVSGSVFVIALRWEDATNEWLVGSCKSGEMKAWSAGVRVFSRN